MRPAPRSSTVARPPHQFGGPEKPGPFVVTIRCKQCQRSPLDLIAQRCGRPSSSRSRAASQPRAT
eukprot:5763285-Lingulodinium_polyedra.AAC.1